MDSLTALYTKIISTHTLTWSVTRRINSIIKLINISTHTLTWSVTDSTANENTDRKISTHTLTWSVTMVRKS